MRFTTDRKRVLPVLLVSALLLHAADHLQGQEYSIRFHTIRLRLYGQQAEPLNRKDRKRRNTIRLLDNRGITLRASYDRYMVYDLDLPDTTIYVERMPVDLAIEQDQQEMRLRLEGDIDTIHFLPGTFHVPYLWIPLFQMKPMRSDVTILGQDIERFRVNSISDEPSVATLLVDSAIPYRLPATQNVQSISLQAPFEQYAASVERDGRVDGVGTAYYRPAAGEVNALPHNALLRSTDQGSTFVPLEPSAASGLFDSASLGGLFYASGGRGWIATSRFATAPDGSINTSSDNVRVFRTDDGGTEWKLDDLFTRLRICDGAVVPPTSDGQEFGWFSGLGEREKGEMGSRLHHFFLYTSEDGGRTLQPINDGKPVLKNLHFSGFRHHPFPRMVALNRNHAFMITSDSTVALHREGDEILLNVLPFTLPDVQVIDRTTAWALGFVNPASRDNSSLSTYLDLEGLESLHLQLYRTTDGGETWDAVLGHLVGFSRIFFRDRDHGALLGQLGIAYTHDAGASWHYTAFYSDKAMRRAADRFGASEWMFPRLPFGPQSVVRLTWLDDTHIRILTSSSYFDLELPAGS